MPACHATTESGGLRLDSREAALRGGKSGPALKPGLPAASLLLEAVNHTHPKLKMPPGAKLPDDEIAALTSWIQSGAPWSAKSPAGFWSFQPLHQPPTGATIDSLIRKSLSAKSLKPTPRAPSAVLLRRLSFDLTGLPPTPEELQEPSLEHAVDRMLALPRFGERWARYWLDVARFGEDDFTGTEKKSSRFITVVAS